MLSPRRSIQAQAALSLSLPSGDLPGLTTFCLSDKAAASALDVVTGASRQHGCSRICNVRTGDAAKHVSPSGSLSVLATRPSVPRTGVLDHGTHSGHRASGHTDLRHHAFETPTRCCQPGSSPSPMGGAVGPVVSDSLARSLEGACSLGASAPQDVRVLHRAALRPYVTCTGVHVNGSHLGLGLLLFTTRCCQTGPCPSPRGGAEGPVVSDSLTRSFRCPAPACLFMGTSGPRCHFIR